MEVTIQDVKNIAVPILSAGYPVLIRGPHGLGKSKIVYDIARELGFQSSNIIERRLSQMSEGEMIGLPVVSGDVTKYNPMDWFHKCCREACLLFLDEIDRASDENRQACFQIMDSRTFNGNVLHPGTIVMAAINGGKYGASYRVRTMDPAELSRYGVIDVMPDVESWLSWAKTNNNIHPAVINFISENRSLLHHSGVFEPNKVYPCPRSWERFSQTLVKNKILKDNDTPPTSIVSIGTAFIGDVASPFYLYLTKNFVKYSVDDMLAGKYNSIFQTPMWQAKGIPAIIGDLEHNATLTEWKTLVPDMQRNVKNFCEFISNINSNEQLFELLKALPSIGTPFTRDCDDFTKYFENFFLHHLFSYEEKNSKGNITYKFTEYITQRLATILPEDADQETVNKLLNGSGKSNDENS